MPTLFIAGDSTAALKEPDKKPMSGWGEFFQTYFKEDLRVDNRAVNGRSTKSFMAEGRLAEIERDFRPGDYLFIQFGHNDGKHEDPDRYTDPAGEYRINLRRYVSAAQQLGGTPVLLTSVSRRRYLPSGLLDPQSVEGYPQAMRELARENGIILLDLFAATHRLYRLLGREGCRQLFVHLKPGEHPNYPEGLEDNTHFSDLGARLAAALVAEAVLRSPALSALHSHMQRSEFVCQP